MTSKAIRLNIGSIFPKGPGKIYFYRYQVDGHRKTDIAVSTHNRKIKRLRKIFSTLSDFRDDENPFRTTLFRREREEQDIGVRRLAFSREQEQQLLEVLADDTHQVINKPEIRVVYYLGMYTGQRLKDCVLLQNQCKTRQILVSGNNADHRYIRSDFQKPVDFICQNFHLIPP